MTIEHTKNDNIEHPKHYTSHPSGIECIHRECLLNMRPYSRQTIEERFNRVGLARYHNDVVYEVEGFVRANFKILRG